jgi:DNA ligase-4
VQSQSTTNNVVCVADKELVKVISIKKGGKISIVRPAWLFDCIEQNQADLGKQCFLLPMEPSHMFHTAEADLDMIEQNADEFGDSYCRDITVDQLKRILTNMPMRSEIKLSNAELMGQFEEHGIEFGETRGSLFRSIVVYIDQGRDVEIVKGDTELKRDPVDVQFIKQNLAFGGAKMVNDLADKTITHIIIGEDRSKLSEIRQKIAKKQKIPRMVTMGWVLQSWQEKTILDEERFAP